MGVVDFPQRKPEPNWQSQLLYGGRKGDTLQSCVANVVLILSNDEPWIGIVARNEFSAADASFRKSPPWDSAYAPRKMPKAGDPWSDADDSRAATWLANAWQLKVAPQVVAEAVKVAAQRNAFHPVRDYFEGLEHDGTPRLATWLTAYMRAETSSYTEAVGRWWMISAVARIYQPGAKCDHLVIFESPQGFGKSTALKLLAGNDWFTDEIGDLGSKDAAMQLQGRLIVELAELDALRKAEWSRVKAFLSRCSDNYRPPWGRRVVDVPRQCIFGGSTNHSQYHQDETGARRLWGVPCGRADLTALERDRSQLWAEAVAEYRDGKEWWPTTAAEHAELAERQEDRRQADPWEPQIADWLALPRGEVTTANILSSCLDKKVGDWTRADENRIGACMRALGWVGDRGRDAAGKQYRFWRKTEVDQ